MNYVCLSNNGSGSKGSSHSSIYSLLPTCHTLSLPPCRVLIPQRGRVSEPERDGDGGGLLMWRSAAAIATWGLLSFNQTKPWWRMCTARGNCRGFGGGGGRGQGRPVRKGARRLGRVAQGGSTEIRTSHSFLPLRHDKTKKTKKGSLLHQFITWAGEMGQSWGELKRKMGILWHSKD